MNSSLVIANNLLSNPSKMISFLILSFFSVNAGAINFRDCGATAGKFNKVEISNCDLTKPTCELKKGTNVSIRIDFTPNEDTDSITAIVHAIMTDINIQFPIPNNEACSDNQSGINCPVEAHTETTYHATLPILPNYPTISITVKWELKDVNGANIVCIEVPVSIK